VVPHAEYRSDDPALLPAPEFDHHLAIDMPHVHVRWCVLAGWEEDDHPKAGDAQDRGQLDNNRADGFSPSPFDDAPS
jgi:hypothetical protein